MRNDKWRLRSSRLRANLRNVEVDNLDKIIIKGIDNYLLDNGYQSFSPNLLLNQTQLELAIYIRKQVQLYLTGKKTWQLKAIIIR